MFALLLSCASIPAEIFSVNIAVDSKDPLLADRMIDLQDGYGQSRVRDSKPAVSAPFFGKDSGLYWAEATNLDLRDNYRSRGYIVYVDSYGQALTVLEISSQELYPGLKITNISSLDIIFTEEIRKSYKRVYDDYKNPIYMTADLVDGGSLFLDQVRHSNMTTNYKGLFGENDFILDWECYFPVFYAGLFRDIKSIRINDLAFKFINRVHKYKLSKVHYLESPFAIEVFPSNLPTSIDSPVPEISYPETGMLKWFEDAGSAYLTFDGKTIAATNRKNGEQIDLIRVITNYTKNDEGLLEVTFVFTDLIGNGQLKICRFTPFFFTSSNVYDGVVKYAELDLRNEKKLTYTFETAFKADKYDFELFNISLMFRSGNVIKSLLPVGDVRNPFTLLKQNAGNSSSWISNPLISYLYWENGTIVAVNTETGERENLLEVDEVWGKYGNSGSDLIINFKDLSNGRVLGGSYFGILKSENANYQRNVISFSFDEKDINTWAYEYIYEDSGNVSAIKKNLDSEYGIYYKMMTISFKDGNCMQVFIPLKDTIWFNQGD